MPMDITTNSQLYQFIQLVTHACQKTNVQYTHIWSGSPLQIYFFLDILKHFCSQTVYAF